jgi:WD40 repeat protein
MTVRGHSSGVDGVAFSPDGKRLATASDDCTRCPVLPCRPIVRLKRSRKLLLLRGSSRGMACEVGCTEFSLGTVDKLRSVAKLPS